jgi:hypothetical protein
MEDFMNLLFKRPDGSFVAEVNGQPYHVIEGDTFAPAGLWDWAVAEAARLGDDLQFEPGPPPPTPEQMQAGYTAAIEAHVEATARARGYTSAVSCATYAASTVPAWQAEGAAFVAWRDDVWTAALAMLAAVQAGGAIPESPIAGLPEMEWPA